MNFCNRWMYFSRELFALISIVFALVRKFATARDRAREGLMMMRWRLRMSSTVRPGSQRNEAGLRILAHK